MHTPMDVDGKRSIRHSSKICIHKEAPMIMLYPVLLYRCSYMLTVISILENDDRLIYRFQFL
jgi:hypothetical protein